MAAIRHEDKKKGEVCHGEKWRKAKALRVLPCENPVQGGNFISEHAYIVWAQPVHIDSTHVLLFSLVVIARKLKASHGFLYGMMPICRVVISPAPDALLFLQAGKENLDLRKGQFPHLPGEIWRGICRLLPTQQIARALGPSCMALHECANMPSRTALPGLLLPEASARCLYHYSHRLICRFPLDFIYVTSCPTKARSCLAFEWMMKRMHGASVVQLSLHQAPHAPCHWAALHDADLLQAELMGNVLVKQAPAGTEV